MQINYSSVIKEFPKLQLDLKVIQKFAEKIIEIYEEQRNPKLTLKELDKMYGLPIYIVEFNKNKRKNAWYTNDGIIDNSDILSTTNTYELSPYGFKLSEYSKTWIAFRYENRKYIDFSNAKLNFDDFSTDRFYYFICEDDKKTGWKEIICIEDCKIKVYGDNGCIEYFEFDQYDKTWRTYEFYRESI